LECRLGLTVQQTAYPDDLDPRDFPAFWLRNSHIRMAVSSNSENNLAFATFLRLL